MNKIILLLLLSLNFSIAELIAQNINTAESKISFDISNMKINTVKGSLSNLIGDVSFDETNLDLCQFNVCVDAATIETGNDKRDEHLKKEDYFDVDNFPQICYESTSTAKNGDSYLSKGLLKLHGIEKEIEINFTYEANSLIGSFQINRTDFGIGGKGTFMVGDEVKIYIHCSLE